jgi:hypothetical protein
MKNQIAAAFKKNQIVTAFIVGGAIIIATPIFVFVLIRLVCVLGITAALGRPISKNRPWRAEMASRADSSRENLGTPL